MASDAEETAKERADSTEGHDWEAEVDHLQVGDKELRTPVDAQGTIKVAVVDECPVPGSAQASSRLGDVDQDLLRGLVSLRAAIVARHTEVLRSFDLQLQKAKVAGNDSNGPIHSPASSSTGTDDAKSAHWARAAPTTGRFRRKAPQRPPNAKKSLSVGAVMMEEDDVPSRPSSVKSDEEAVSIKMSGVQISPHVQQVPALDGPEAHRVLPGQMPDTLPDLKSDEEEVGLTSIVPERRARRAKTAKEHLPTLSAKRRTSWLTRSAKVAPAKKERHELVKLSRNEKAEAKKEAERAHGGGVGLLSKFQAEYSTTAVLKSAAAGVGSDHAKARQRNRCSQIVMNPWFERLALGMVLLNAVEMALDVELNRHQLSFHFGSSPLFVVSHNLFCVFFLTELVIRYFAHGGLRHSFRDAWFSFEALLAILMMLETWVMPALDAMNLIHANGAAQNTASSLRFARVLRVLRTARLARLVRFMPELMILVKGMVVACRSVFFTLLLLLIVTVIFSINFMEFSRGIPALEAVFFDSLWNSVGTLILHCILPDQEVFFRLVAQESEALAALVLMFILLGSFTVMNMLLGVLVEAVKTVTLIERENLDAELARKVLWNMLENDGTDDDERWITREEFEELLSRKKAGKALASIGVDVSAAADIGKMLFEDDEAILFLDFMSAMLMLRGSNKTTVKDIVELRKFVAEEFLKVHSLVGELCGFLAEHLEPPESDRTLRRVNSPADLD